MTSKIFSNIGPNDLIAYRIEKGFSKALVCHNAPLDTDLTGVVSWVKTTAQAKSFAVQTTAAYTGNNCYPISGLSAGVAYDLSIAFTDEFASSNATLLRAQYENTNTILTNIHASSFTANTPATISEATKLTNLTKDLGSLTVRLGIVGHTNVDRLLVEVNNASAGWVTAYTGASAPVVDILVPEGDYQLRVTSIIDFSDGSEDTSTPQVYGGANVVVDPELDSVVGARTLIVSASSLVFPFDSAGTPIGTDDIVVTAKIQNIVDGTTVWTTVPANIGTDNLDDTYTITQADFGTLTSVKVTATRNDLSDTTTIVRLQDGATGAPVTVVLSNDNHTLPADVDGTVLDLSNSGTQVHVYEGTTPLAYDGIGTADGTWKITNTSPSNVTVGSITDGGSFAQVGNLVGMGLANPSGSITYNVSGVLANGTAFVAAPITQSFSKALAGTPAKGISLSATSQSFTYNEDGHFGATSITVTANLQNVTGTVAWGTSGAVGTPSGTSYTITEAQFGASNSVTITGTLGEFSDSITITRLTDGSAGVSAMTAILSNSTHSIPADPDGVVTDFSGSGTSLSVYEGTTALTYAATPSAGQWKATLTATNVTSPGISGGSVGDLTAMSADTGSLSFNITGFRIDGVAFDPITVVQTFSKSKQGTQGTVTSGDRGATNLYVVVPTTTLSSGWGAAADTAADDATPGDNIIGDRITLLDNISLIETRVWTVSSGWQPIDQILDGNILFPGSVTASKIDVEDLFAGEITATGSINAQGAITAGTGGNKVTISGTAANLISATSGGVNLFYVSASGGGRASGTWLTPGTVPFTALSQDAVDKLSNQVGATAESTGGTKSVDFNFSGNTGASPITLPTLKHGSNVVTITFAGSGSSNSGGGAGDPSFNLTIKRSGTPIYGPTPVNGSAFTDLGSDSRFISVDVSDTDNPTAGDYLYTAEITSANNISGMNISGTFKVTEDVAGGGAGSGGTPTVPYVGVDDTGSAVYSRILIGNNPTSNADFIRAASNAGGLLPYSDGNSSLGLDLWRWKDIHATTIYENGTELSAKYLLAENPTATGTNFSGNSKVILEFTDTWLRLNPSASFTAGIYCGTSTLRTDGEIHVGPSGNKLKVATDGSVTSAGAFYASSDITAFSDIRLKTDIVPIQDALAKLTRLGGYTFTRKDLANKKQIGVIAQEVEKEFPELVIEVEGTKTVSYGNLAAVLIEAVKEQQIQIEELKKLCIRGFNNGE